MNVIASIFVGVLGFLFMVGVAVASLAFLAGLAMGVWALVFALLGYFLPDLMAAGRAAVGIDPSWAFWQIGAGVGLVLFLLRTALSSTTTVNAGK